MLSPATTSPPHRRNLSYFVVMQDFGPKLGLGADVAPELTRSDIVDRIKSGEYREIVRIDHIADGLAEDVTCEMIDEAEAQLRGEAEQIVHRAQTLRRVA